MLKLSGLRLARGAQVLIDGGELTLFPGERLAFVGANGAGKSTLLAAIRGELAPQAGDIALPPSWRISHVAQETPALPDSALDFVLQGDEPLQAIERELRHLEARHVPIADSGQTAAQPSNDPVDGEQAMHAANRLGELYALKQDIDGYAAPARVSALLHGLGFSAADLQRPVADFSGGWRMRLNLARALGSRAELILLDEPTNHLDIEAVLWLEDWLVRCGTTLIVVSHDREFLDAVATHTLHLENGKLTRYTGGYSAFETLYAEQNRQQNLAAARQSQELEKLQRFVDRFRAKATKATQAQSRLKRIEKMQRIAAVRPPASIDLGFLPPERKPDPLVTLVRSDCGYAGGRTILQGITLEVRMGDRIGLLGQNGNGKSTLIKSLMGDLPLLGGERQPGNGLQVGYFAQHQVDSLRADDRAIDHLRRHAPQQTEQALRDFLGRFGFSGERAMQAIGTLSGGEKARLSLATIIHGKPNLLLLDEPTNHLDIPTREALAEALLDFEGAMVMVSHDRHLLESVTDRFLRVHGGRLTPWDEDLDAYAKQLLRDTAQAASATAGATAVQVTARTGSPDVTGVSATTTAAASGAAKPVKSSAAVGTSSVSAGTQQERQALQNERKTLERRLQQADRHLATLREQIAALDAALTRDDAYSPANLAKTQVMSQERIDLDTRFVALEEQWLEDTLRLETVIAAVDAMDAARARRA